MAVELISISISAKVWDGPGFNSRSLDLQADMLPTALYGPVKLPRLDLPITSENTGNIDPD